MSHLLSLSRALFLVGCGGTALAQLSPGFVKVGFEGWPDDPLTGFGNVDYPYLIGTGEVTNTAYVAFLNAVATTSDPHGLYDPRMDGGPFGVGGIVRSGTAGHYTYAARPGYEHKPVCYVSYWDAARFANWLSNQFPDRPTGVDATETGAYELGGVTNPDPADIRRVDGWRATPYLYFLPTLDEWYKAAYFQPSFLGGPEDHYWQMPTKSDEYPVAEPPPGGGNSANLAYAVGEAFTDVGAYVDSPSFFGTFDQGGNIWEWHDLNPDAPDALWRTVRGARGGFYGSSSDVRSDAWSFSPPDDADYYLGFRLVMLEPLLPSTDPDLLIPEPKATPLLHLLLVILLSRHRRRR